MEQEIFENPAETPTTTAMPETPKTFGQKLYPLDWKDTEVKLAKGRFSHTLSRPSAEMLIEREDELETEIPIAKDGSYALPDDTINEEIDAKYYDSLQISATGYEGREIPTLHKAKALQGLYKSEIYFDEDADIFGDEICILQEIGGTEFNPNFTVRHILRSPGEKQLRKYRSKGATTRIVPGKRGRQKLVMQSNIRLAMQFYAEHLIRVEGATLGGEKFTNERRDEFIEAVDPLAQKAVFNCILSELNEKLSD